MMGGIHADYALVFTRLIDAVAYRGRNMRRGVANEMSSRHPSSTTVVELGCGVGTLTTELVRNGYNVTAVDTSNEMMERAKRNVPRAMFRVQNAVDVDAASADVVVACMLFHELPPGAHKEILETMLPCPRIWVVDISKSYLPSRSMLYGEPYVPSYLSTIEDTITTFASRHDRILTKVEVISGHVDAWILTETETVL